MSASRASSDAIEIPLVGCVAFQCARQRRGCQRHRNWGGTSFNSSLIAPEGAIAFANKLVNRGALPEQIKTMLIHAIELMKDLGLASKYNADWHFLPICVM
jgi:hypothetical protein